MGLGIFYWVSFDISKYINILYFTNMLKKLFIYQLMFLGNRFEL